jgi:hypothetical protein
MAMTPAERIKKWRDLHPDLQKKRNYVYVKRHVVWNRIKKEFCKIDPDVFQ